MTKLTDKVALISGSGRGIGRALALKLANEGAKVVVNDLDQEPANNVAGEIKASGGDAVVCAGNVTESGFAEQFVDTAIQHYAGIDIIINNAGYTWDSVIHKMTDEQWHAMLDVHLTAPVKILRAAAGHIRSAAKAEAAEQREVFRKVVNISSMSGLSGNAGQVSYSAAKAGIIGVTRTLAKEWGRYKVNVNCVAYGVIDTRLTHAFSAEESTSIKIAGQDIKVGLRADFKSILEQSIPLGRVGRAEEAADAVYLFCIPESNYISGQFINCSGGLRI